MTSAEVAVIGGGPAGATAARLLAEWGHSVVLFAGPHSQQPLAESLPPSTRKVLAAVDALGLVEGAGFLATTGNTSWWGTDTPRVEPFPDGGQGWQVLRRDLQALLLRAAVTAGVLVAEGTRVREVRPEADGGQGLEVEDASGTRARLPVLQVLDASGRAGVVARHGFRTDEGPRTLAVTAVFERPSGFAVPDDTHTLVESHAFGWAWSVPLAPGTRHVTVMLDPPRASRSGLVALYERELRLGPHMAALIEGARRVKEPWAADASTYGASAFAAPGVALVGDAGAFIDPLSSYGVKKALASAWLAAVATHTALLYPERAEMARGFFARREGQVLGRYAHEAARYAGEAALRYPGSAFWTARAAVPAAVDDPDDALAADREIQASFEGLKWRPHLSLGLGPGVRIAPAPLVVGHEIVVADALLRDPGVAVHSVEGVHAPTLARLAPQADQVGDLYEAYNRAAPAVALGEFLRGLATLLAAGFLLHDASKP